MCSTQKQPCLWSACWQTARFVTLGTFHSSDKGGIHRRRRQSKRPRPIRLFKSQTKRKVTKFGVLAVDEKRSCWQSGNRDVVLIINGPDARLCLFLLGFDGQLLTRCGITGCFIFLLLLCLSVVMRGGSDGENVQPHYRAHLSRCEAQLRSETKPLFQIIGNETRNYH